MRKLSIYILLLMAAGCLACCSDSNEKESGMLSSEGLIELRADYPGLSVGTKAIAKEFQTTLFCVARSGDYTGLSERFSTPVTDITSDWQNAVFYEEWVEREATVATNGTIRPANIKNSIIMIMMHTCKDSCLAITQPPVPVFPLSGFTSAALFSFVNAPTVLPWQSALLFAVSIVYSLAVISVAAPSK